MQPKTVIVAVNRRLRRRLYSREGNKLRARKSARTLCVVIELHKNSIKLQCDKDENGGVKEWIFELSLFSRAAKKEYNLSTGSLIFKAIVPAKSAGSVRTILERCYDEVYSIAGSKIKYDNGKWYLLLCYSFDKPKAEPSKEQMKNIMGVHIAEHNAVICTFSHKPKKYTIDGGEVLAFATQIERRRRNIGMASSKHSVLCGDGRVGHGYRKKMEPLNHISNKISNFRNTTNHRYSRQIVNWAVANKCGVIQIEDLSGLASEELERSTLISSLVSRKVNVFSCDFCRYTLISFLIRVFPCAELSVKCSELSFLEVG